MNFAKICLLELKANKLFLSFSTLFIALLLSCSMSLFYLSDSLKKNADNSLKDIDGVVDMAICLTPDKLDKLGEKGKYSYSYDLPFSAIVETEDDFDNRIGVCIMDSNMDEEVEIRYIGFLAKWKPEYNIDQVDENGNHRAVLSYYASKRYNIQLGDIIPLQYNDKLVSFYVGDIIGEEYTNANVLMINMDSAKHLDEGDLIGNLNKSFCYADVSIYETSDLLGIVNMFKEETLYVGRGISELYETVAMTEKILIFLGIALLIACSLVGFVFIKNIMFMRRRFVSILYTLGLGKTKILGLYLLISTPFYILGACLGYIISGITCLIMKNTLETFFDFKQFTFYINYGYGVLFVLIVLTLTIIVSPPFLLKRINKVEFYN